MPFWLTEKLCYFANVNFTKNYTYNNCSKNPWNSKSEFEEKRSCFLHNIIYQVPHMRFLSVLHKNEETIFKADLKTRL